MNIKTVIIFFSITFGFSSTHAQEAPISDSTSLKPTIQNQLSQLRTQETDVNRAIDSLAGLLDAQRKIYSTQASDSVGLRIIDLESTVFDLRSQLSLLGSQISTLQAQESILSLENPNQSDNSSNSNVINILDSDFFAEYISEQQLAHLHSSRDISSEFEANLSRVNALYENIQALEKTYNSTSAQSVVDSIVIRSYELRHNIKNLDKQLSQKWRELYRTKLDHYMVLTDHLEITDRDMLERLDVLSRDAYSAQESSAIESMAPSIVAYIPQRELLLEYELLFADELALPVAKDSLKALQKSLSAKEINPLNDIQFKWRSISIYSDITLGNTYPYSNIEDVPAIKVPQEGVYYAIQVALITRPASSLSIFKGAEPLQLERTATGGYRYVLGGFASYDLAQDALSQCKSAQFRNPVLVAWVDGEFSTVANAKAYQAKHSQHNPSKQGYGIKITSSNSDIASEIRSILDSAIDGEKSISRSQNGNDVNFTISNFPTASQARVISHILKSELGTQCQVDIFDIGQSETE